MTGEAVSTATTQKCAIELEQHECDMIMAALTISLMDSRDNEVCISIMKLQEKIRKITKANVYVNNGVVWVDEEFEASKRRNYPKET